MECLRATLAKINFHAYVGRPLNLMMEERLSLISGPNYKEK